MMPRVPPKLASRLAALVLVAGLGGGAFVAQQVSDEALRDEYVRAVAADADTDTWGLRYEQFVAPLILAVQQLQARVAVLEGRD